MSVFVILNTLVVSMLYLVMFGNGLSYIAKRYCDQFSYC